MIAGLVFVTVVALLVFGLIWAVEDASTEQSNARAWAEIEASNARMVAALHAAARRQAAEQDPGV